MYELFGDTGSNGEEKESNSYYLLGKYNLLVTGVTEDGSVRENSIKWGWCDKKKRSGRFSLHPDLL